MLQQTLADEGFECYRSPTCREQFLEEMDKIVPLEDLCEFIEPLYPRPECADRPLIGLDGRLRIQFYSTVSTSQIRGVEGVLHDSCAILRMPGNLPKTAGTTHRVTWKRRRMRPNHKGVGEWGTCLYDSQAKPWFQQGALPGTG